MLGVPLVRVHSAAPIRTARYAYQTERRVPSVTAEGNVGNGLAFFQRPAAALLHRVTECAVYTPVQPQAVEPADSHSPCLGTVLAATPQAMMASPLPVIRRRLRRLHVMAALHLGVSDAYWCLSTTRTEAVMQEVTLIGIDLEMHSFHAHGQHQRGKAVFRQKYTRAQRINFLATFHHCTVVIEACTGAHQMARHLASY